MRIRIRQIANLPAMRAILSFFDSLWFPAAYAVLALVSSFTGMEIAFYAITAAIVVFTSVFSRDSKPLLVPVFMGVYAVSRVHAPQPPVESDFFYNRGVQIYLLCLGAAFISCLIFRFIVFPQDRNFFKESKLRLGIILMAAAFLLNGVFFGGYKIADLPFGLLTALSFFALYIYFYNTLYIGEGTGRYVGRLLVMTAGIIFLQLCKIYIFDGVVSGGSVNKDNIITGWGTGSDIGGMLAIFLPACFYIAYTCRRFGFIFYVLGFVFFAGTLLTFSLTSVLVGGAVLIAAAIYLSVKRSPVRRFARIFSIAVIVACAVLAAVFRDLLYDFFAVFLERGLGDTDRLGLWSNGIRNFLRAPLFGAGFFGSPENLQNAANRLLPEMYCNIFIQMLASCGIFGLIAYIVHILQAAFAVRRDPTSESMFYIAVLVSIFAMSLSENFIFRVFPAMVYSVFLLLSEREGEDGPLLLVRPLLIRLIRRKKREEGAEGAASAAGGGACNSAASCNAPPKCPAGERHDL